MVKGLWSKCVLKRKLNEPYSLVTTVRLTGLCGDPAVTLQGLSLPCSGSSGYHHRTICQSGTGQVSLGFLGVQELILCLDYKASITMVIEGPRRKPGLCVTLDFL